MPARPDPLHQLLGRVAALSAAPDVTAALRAAVEAACAATASPRGLAGIFDGEAAVSDAWFDEDQGWSPARRRWSADETGPAAVCRAGAAQVTAAGADGPPFLARAACVPLRDEAGAAFGFLQVGDGPEYGPPELERLEDVAALAALRLAALAGEAARGAERSATDDIKQGLEQLLRPSETVRQPGLDIATAYSAAGNLYELGGDFIDYYRRSRSDSFAFVIGDVAGKGAEAMARTFMTKYVLRAAVRGGQLSWPVHPGSALQELRTGLLELREFDALSEHFVTVLFGLVSPSRGLLELASAGHPAPFIVRPGRVERPLLLTEPAIGVELGAALAPYPSETIDLGQGDVIVAFTDGIAELRDAGGRFFEDELSAVLAPLHDAPAAEVVARVMGAGAAFSALPPADDLALLCIRLTTDILGEG